MSFFIKGNTANGKSYNKKFPNLNGRKRKAPTKSRKSKDVDVTSSEDDDPADQNDDHNIASSEDERETAQEKKLRLAKLYLEEIERAELRKLENQDLDDATKGNLIEQRLKEDYLKQQGKLRISVADKYTGAGEITILKCKEHKNTVTAICISSDGFVYSGSKDGGIVKWSLREHKKVASLPFVKSCDEKHIVGHSESILSIAISSDNKFLVVGDRSPNIQIWHPDSLTHISTLKGHKGAITGLAFRKETHTLFSASSDRSMKVWSLDEMAYVETMYGHLDAITAIDSLTRERAITSGGRDKTLRIWKVAEESQLIYNGHTGSIDHVQLINEENFISGGDDGVLNIWGVNKKKPLCSVKDAHGIDPTNKQPNWITSVTSMVNTDLVATGSYDGKIKVWKLSKSFKAIDKLFEIEVVGFINDLKFSNNGEFLIAATGSEHRLGRWNVIKKAKNTVLIIPLLQS